MLEEEEQLIAQVHEIINELRANLATVTQDQQRLINSNEHWHVRVEQMIREVEQVTQERDEQCAEKMAFYNGMNDMREQRTTLERQLAKVTNDTQYHMDCITLLAKHIGRLGETSHTVVHAAIQQLAAKKHEEGLP